ncbi:arginine--tRNA ligase [Streptomyces albus]|uniref:arginine--tRNA ligase domain-containing protein n=1 Tax=Streptomyces albus TaxID=1888 RepID=UPI0031F6836F
MRKADGGFVYAATDLAAIPYRTRELAATRILFVVDARQAQYFDMIFRAAHRAGWLADRPTAPRPSTFRPALSTARTANRSRAGSAVPSAWPTSAQLLPVHKFTSFQRVHGSIRHMGFLPPSPAV